MNIRIVIVSTILIQAIALQVNARPIPFESCFELASRQHQVKIDLLMAVAYQESSWKADARSNANAHGVMQIQWPETAHHLGSRRVAELYNPCLNINLGARYLRELTDKYNGDTSLVLAAYNYGPTRIKSKNDIPHRVQGYINSVRRHQDRIQKQISLPSNLLSSLSAETSNRLIELIRFSQHQRALRYLSSLQGQVPGAALSFSRKENHSIIFLNQKLTTTEARYRLARLLPDLY